MILVTKSPTSKLFKLKQWLTLHEAAKHLSGICGEEVTEADILRLGLDSHLKLSVYFVNHTYAKMGCVVYFDEKKLSGLTSDGIYPEELKWGELPFSGIALMSLKIGANTFINIEENDVQTIGGVWDLPMIGGESLDIEHQWQNLTYGPEVTLQNLNGAFVEGRDGVMCKLQESFDHNPYKAGSTAQLEILKQYVADNNISKEKTEELFAQHKEDRKKYLENKDSRPKHEDYYPASGLPEDSVLVVRTDALREFEQLISDTDQDKNSPTKPHGNTEINAQKREQILGAAMSVLANWPEQCRNSAGKFEATKIATRIDEKSLLYWPKTGEPPLSREKMEREISKWIKMAGK